jgi:hypothetical protein
MNNEIMNCQCFQRITENDLKKHSTTQQRHDGSTVTETANKNQINLISSTTYRKKVISNHNKVVIDLSLTDNCGIPIYYCPICGTPTVNNT